MSDNDILFENRYVATKANVFEFHLAVTFRLKWVIVVGVILLLSTIGNIVGMLFGDNKEAVGRIITNAVYVVIFVGVLLLQNRRNVKEYFEREHELNHGQIRENVIRVGNGFVVINELTGGTYHVDFSQIIRCIETKHLIILVTKAKNYLTFRKDAFLTGTFEEFKNFLIKTYPLLKIKK